MIFDCQDSAITNRENDLCASIGRSQVKIGPHGVDFLAHPSCSAFVPHRDASTVAASQARPHELPHRALARLLPGPRYTSIPGKNANIVNAMFAPTSQKGPSKDAPQRGAKPGQGSSGGATASLGRT